MAVNVFSGELRHKVVFKQPVSSLNNEGGEEVDYSDAITTFARVDKFNQFRTTEAMADKLSGSLDFTIRHSIDREAIGKDWLILYRGNNYVIHQIEHLEQKQKFIRFTAKSTGVNDTPAEYTGGVPVNVDRSNLLINFNIGVNALEFVLSIIKTMSTESYIDWGDGTDEIITTGTEINVGHTYSEGQYECRVYPVNGVTDPLAPMVNAIQSISLLKVVGDVVLEFGDSLEACEYLRTMEANDFGMVALPDLPNAGVEQVRSVSVLNNNLNGAELSDLFIQLDTIDWPVGYVEVTGNPGAGSLTTAGETAKQSLVTKGWTVNG
jgi:SPP1 family predicted phage head-tail adaptor